MVIYWRETFRIGNILEINISPWLHTVEKHLYWLHTRKNLPYYILERTLRDKSFVLVTQVREIFPIGYIIKRKLSYSLHFGKKPYVLVIYWRRTFRFGYILERSISYWLKIGEKPYILVAFWRERLRIGYILQRNVLY